MHEKTLLYGALGLTALGAVFAVATKGHKEPSGEIQIAPVSQLDAKTLAIGSPVFTSNSETPHLRLNS